MRDIPDDRLLAVALIENIQREDLNPIEEALAYRRLTDDFHLTQEQIAESVGKDRSSIANYLRLLKLPNEVRESVAGGTLSMGHARALLASATRPQLLRLARDVIASNYRYAKPKHSSRSRRPAPSAEASRERRPHPRRGRQAPLRARHPRPHRPQGQGRRIEIDFPTEDELNGSTRSW